MKKRKFMTNELSDENLQEALDLVRDDKLVKNSISKVVEKIDTVTFIINIEAVMEYIASGMIAMYAYGLKKGREENDSETS